MNPKKLLNTTFDCECGRSHKVPVRELVYAEDALERLPDMLSSLVQGRRVIVIADSRTWDIAGRSARDTLKKSGFSASQIIVPDTEHSVPVCDDTTHDWLNDCLPPADIALAVGSGVINDLTKWSAFDRDIPYVVLATAASMNGYTAANVAPTLNGVKTLIRAQAPLAVLAVPSVIVGAPFELTAAGLGDVIAKPISAADWLLNHVFCDEHFCRYCSRIINDLEPYYLDHPADVKARKPAAIEALFGALVYSGIAMTIIGTSAPASGGEHLLSHTLDMLSGIDGVPHDLHGRQVGLGTLFASGLYERILRIERPDGSCVLPDLDRGFWGPLVSSIDQRYQPKRVVLDTMREKLSDGLTWQCFLDVARRQVRSPQQIKSCLRAAGAAHTFADIGCSGERLLAAALHMHEIRERPTVIDLAWLLGVLPEAAGQIIDDRLTR